MNYKKIKILYTIFLLLPPLILILSRIFGMRDLYINILLLITVFFMIPGIVFRIVYDQKYPAPAKQKKIGWIIAVLALPLGLYGNLILDFIRGLI
jgi:uncharacterized membrane protein YqaE (UPF0057 family)